jgi:hypothetical protein
VHPKVTQGGKAVIAQAVDLVREQYRYVARVWRLSMADRFSSRISKPPTKEERTRDVPR